MASLDPPSFIDRDPETILAACVAEMEGQLDRVLLPAQAERLIVNMIAARELAVRQGIQAAGLLMLARFSDFPALSYIGEIVGVFREDATEAEATFRFVLEEDNPGTIIPAGTRIATKDSAFTFLLDEDLTVGAGETTADGNATCDTAGTAGNGYVAGDVASLLDPHAYVVSVANTTTTAGGADEETKERFFERLLLGPSQFSTAGSEETYRYFTLTAHPSICDATIDVDADTGTITIYPLTVNGLPDESVLASVVAATSAQKVRPLTDEVTTSSPTEVTFEIEAALTFLESADATASLAAANTAALSYQTRVQQKLGADIVPEQIGALLAVDGVYRVQVTSPSELRVLSKSEWAHCTSISLSIAGTAEG